MPSEREIKAAGAALCEASYDYLDPFQRDVLAKAALRAAEAEREVERKENCKHPNKTGNGTVSSDGSSKWNWYCSDCGASGNSEIAPRLVRAGP